MPGKKGNKATEEEDSKRTILGRPGNNLKMGIVGLPNVGKSTLFNTLCKMSVPAENFPFCTIDPTVSRVAVPDERFDFLCEQYKPASKVPAYLTVTDIAGLVKGAHKGEGLGNAFLSHISAVDGIFHVIRIFEDIEVCHTEEVVDPCRDLDIIHEELRLKDIEKVSKQLEGREPQDKKLLERRAMCRKFLEHLEDGKDIRCGKWDAKEIELLNELLLLTAKPCVYLINMSERDFARKRNKWLRKIKEWVDNHSGEPIIPYSGKFEATLLDLELNDGPEAAKKYCADLKCESSLPKIIRTGYSSMNLIYYFTSGADEVRAWTIQRGLNAQKAAGVIHTDFEKKFICGEVMSFDDFKEHGSEQAVKAAGKLRTVGKAHILDDGDICLWKCGGGGGRKKK